MRYLLLLLLPMVALASGDKITQSNDMNNQTAGYIVLGGGGSQAFAFAHGLGDVDIAQCLASTQWGTIIVSKQKIILNMWCAAEVYDQKGMYPNAGRARCSIGEIAQWYTTNEECLAGETWSPPPLPEPDPEPEPAPEPTGVPVSGLLDEFHIEQQQDFETIEQRLMRVEREQRAAAMDNERRLEVVQHTYERLKNDPES